ncbi:hypothetical protein B0H63DRAFT_242315 [Podospora didyma]|uniref:Zn(2)-C6 fungal-type domain-containing protein n=1 Tax=Podospora didyma TaxID=330526 RepID=A0AAE0KKQ7_9PEZI|nr:hypothetical protein B0H63DRAFT_242315 [Podospora didyma]
MGISYYLDPRYRLAIPDTPPELLTPDSSSYSSTQFEERSWNIPTPLSPPMSNYDPAAKANDMLPGKGQDGTQARRDAVPDQNAARQQLPSLSSLFGPPSSQARSFHSPLLDRPGSYASVSPLDRPHGSPTVHDGRPFSSSSYFPPSSSVPSISQPRSARDPRFQDRQPFPSLSRAFPRPLSPHSGELDRKRSEIRPDLSGGNQWPPQHEREYSFGSREALSYIPAQDRFPAQLPVTGRDENPRVSYREHHTPQAHPHVLPTTPASIVTSESLPAKDGLGPKIWTGTHFLPRFVRSAEVPGEGMCYFYDDGSHCKTVIDGEAVNMLWGVTKAGKPRKRLAIACITCREKKIKCDPDYPRCVQCEKFGRVCKFKNAPRGGSNTSPSTPPAELDDSRRLGGFIRPLPDLHARPSSHSSGSVSPRTLHRPASPELSTSVPPKRLRVGYEHFTPVQPQSPAAPASDTARSTMSWHQPELPRLHEDVLRRAWKTDPYVSDPQSVNSTIASFFVHTDATALRFLPEKVFKSWVQNKAHTKSPEDLMLLYSILAASVALSGGSRSIAHEYMQVARYATERAALSLQMVQARILLSLYYLAVARPGDGNEMSSGAISAAICLQLNLELDRSQDGVLEVFPYGMTRAGYAECRRRTFWSCFIHERLNGLFPTRVSIINAEDIFIRLPVGTRSFEEQVGVAAPAFEPNKCSLEQHRLGVGIMGYLVQVVAIWGDVMTSIYRVSHRNTYHSFEFGDFHRHIASRLEDWKVSLPLLLLLSPTNLELAAREDQGALILMHVIFHLTQVKLHRHIHPRFLTTASRAEHAQIARDHARQLLTAMCAVAKDSNMGRSSMPPPFCSFAILEAIDVLSAEGALQELPELVDQLAVARSVLEILGTVWDTAKIHQMTLDHRLDGLASLRDRVPGPDTTGATTAGAPPISGLRLFANRCDGRGDMKLPAGACWQMTDAMEARFPREMDCIYTSLTPIPTNT